MDASESRLDSLTARLATAISLLIWVSGCGSVTRMPLPQDLRSHGTEMGVRKRTTLIKDRTVRLDFGPYRVEGIRRHDSDPEWNGRTGHAWLQAESEYAFRVKSEDGSSWRCGCRNHAEREDRFLPGGRILEIHTSAFLTCDLSPTGGGIPWDLELKEMAITGGNLQGRVSDGNHSISVTGTRACLGPKTCDGNQTGFTFRGETGALGAVEVTRKGRVVFSDGAEKGVQPALAALTEEPAEAKAASQTDPR